MKHIVRVERHLIRDILASMVGGSMVIAVIQRSWLAGLMTVLSGVALYITELVDIEEEEQ